MVYKFSIFQQINLIFFLNTVVRKLKRNKIKYKYIGTNFGTTKNMFKIRKELTIEEYKANKMLREL